MSQNDTLPACDARLQELEEFWQAFLATLKAPTTLEQRAQAWREVDIARMRHEFTLPDTYNRRGALSLKRTWE